MGLYTSVTIGGVDCFVDPDQVSFNLRGYSKVVPSLDGTIFVKYLSQNPANFSYYADLGLTGMYLPEDSLASFQDFVKAKSTVRIIGIPGVDSAIDFLFDSLSHGPIKPAVIFPGDSWSSPPVRNTYNAHFIKVTE